MGCIKMTRDKPGYTVYRMMHQALDAYNSDQTRKYGISESLSLSHPECYHQQTCNNYYS